MIFLPVVVLSCSFFFFSSRRRHTILQGDWSSDVCSSDLRRCSAAGSRAPAAFISVTASTPRTSRSTRSSSTKEVPSWTRSEERRVGGEGRGGGGGDEGSEEQGEGAGEGRADGSIEGE